MSTDLARIMRRDRRRREMLNDPALTGEPLLFALALDEYIETRKDWNASGMGVRSQWTAAVEKIMRGETTSTRASVRAALRKDWFGGRVLPRWLPSSTWDDLYVWALSALEFADDEPPAPGLRLVRQDVEASV